jgi:hypothetical protein
MITEESARAHYYIWQAFSSAGTALEVIDKVEKDDFTELESLCDDAIRRLQEVKNRIKEVVL